MKLPLAFTTLALRLVGRQTDPATFQQCAQLTREEFDALPCITLDPICGPTYSGESITVTPSGDAFAYSSNDGNILYDSGTGLLTRMSHCMS